MRCAEFITPVDETKFNSRLKEIPCITSKTTYEKLHSKIHQNEIKISNSTFIKNTPTLATIINHSTKKKNHTKTHNLIRQYSHDVEFWLNRSGRRADWIASVRARGSRAAARRSNPSLAFALLCSVAIPRQRGHAALYHLPRLPRRGPFHFAHLSFHLSAAPFPLLLLVFFFFILYLCTAFKSISGEILSFVGEFRYYED